MDLLGRQRLEQVVEFTRSKLLTASLRFALRAAPLYQLLLQLMSIFSDF